MRRTLASAAILIGLAVSTNAQNFAPPVEVGFGLTKDSVPIFHFADIDNDGDQDAFISMYYDTSRTFGFQENTGTPEVANFGPVQINPYNLTLDFNVTTIDLADVDMDGDLDLFMGSYTNEYPAPPTPIFGWENMGTAENPSFSLPNPASNPFNIQPSDEVSDVVFADLDGDGDPDLLMEEYMDDAPVGFRYQENLGIMGSFPEFGPVQIDPFGLNNEDLGVIILNFGDLDNDGDLDALVGGAEYDYYGTSFYYYENTGTVNSPAFAASVANPFGLQIPNLVEVIIPSLVDIDNDGDLDVIATTYNEDDENSVFFFENLGGSVNTETVTAIRQMSLFPTVAENNIQWEVLMDETVNQSNLQIVDIHGRTVYTETVDLNTGANQGIITVEDFGSGMYILNITNENGKTLVSRRFFVQ